MAVHPALVRPPDRYPLIVEAVRNSIVALQHFSIGGRQKGGWFFARGRVITSDMEQAILKSMDDAASAYGTLVLGLLVAIAMNAVFVLTHISQ